jgi:hypothetical protein
MSILGKIRKEVTRFETEKVSIIEGYSFNQKETLRRIELYFNSKFESGEFDSQGFKKFFYNIVQFPVDIEAKATDIDTKDYVFVPESIDYQTGTFLIQKEFIHWLKENKWGQKLNELVRARPKYGTVVVKKVKDTIKPVNLHNLINDPRVEHLWQGPVIETHVMTSSELRAMPWDKKAIEDIIELYEENFTENEIIVRERYGYCQVKDLDPSSDSDEVVYAMVVAAGVEKVEIDQTNKIERELGEVLYYTEITAPKDELNLGDFPYRESHRRKMHGRWLGIGKVEELFDPQIRMNELQNIKSKGLYWSSLQLFQSRDKTVARNMLEDVLNGEILRTDSEITPVNTARTNLADFNQEEQRWDKNVQERAFTFEVETGQSLPSGTPFRLGALLAQKSGGFFNMMREDMGLFLVDLFYECMVPLFKKNKKKKHIVMLPVDEEGLKAKIEEYAEFLLFEEVNSGKLPPNLEERRQAIREKLMSRGFFPIEVPDSFYDDIKFKIKLAITDEQLDFGQKMESVSNLLQVISGNPLVLQNPEIRGILFEILNLAGLNPSSLGINKPIPQRPVLQGTQGNEAIPVGQQVNQVENSINATIQ